VETDNLLLIAERQIVSGDLAAASTALSQYEAHFGGDWRSVFLRSIIAAMLGNDSAALTLRNTSIKMKPELKHFSFGDALLKQQGLHTLVDSLKTTWANYREIAAADTLVISYPKCGRTWLRLLLSRVFSEHYNLAVSGPDTLELEKFPLMNEAIPRVQFSHDDNPHWILCEQISVGKDAYCNKNIVFLVRDPRDVVVSYYFQYTKRGDRILANDRDFTGSIDDFAFHDIGGIPSVVKFYNAWCEAAPRSANVLFIRYEDLHSHPASVLQSVLRHLGQRGVRDDCLASAVKFCEFDKMREYELTNKFQNRRLFSDKNADPEGFKTRRGKVGGYRQYLSDKTLSKINAYIQENLTEQLACYK